MRGLIFDTIYAMAIVGGVCFLLVISEVLFDFAYKHISLISKWFDNFCEGTPDYNDEESEAETYE